MTISNGGMVSAAGTGSIGSAAGSTGTATVTGTGSSWTNGGQLRVGNSGTGSLSITNGGQASSTSTTYVGVNSGSTGTLTVNSGGQLSSLNSQIGGNSGGIGTATISGTGSSWTNSGYVQVGANGTGTLTVNTGASISSMADSYIGTNSGSVGTATVDGTGSSWASAGQFQVGSSANGTLTVSNGAHVSNTSYGIIGAFAGSTGTATVDGTGSSWTNATSLGVGRQGVGRLTVSNGGMLNDTTGYIADYTASTGTATVTGTGSNWANSSDLYIGNIGTGTLTIANGGTVTTASGTSYNYDDSDTTTTPRTSSSTVYIAALSGSTGTLNIGGTGGGAAAAAGTVSASTVAFGAGTGTINFNHTGTGYVFAPAITGNGTIGILAGTTLFTGDSSGFTGSTIIRSGGVLGVTGLLGGAGSTAINVGSSSAGTLNVTSGGKVTSISNTIGANSGVSGTVAVTGTGSNLTTTTGQLRVGSSGTGSLTVSGGGGVNSGAGYVGTLTGSTGTATITGTGSSWTSSNNLIVGNSGIGTLNIQNGASASDVAAGIGQLAGSTGAATVDGIGSSWTHTSNLFVGNSGTGTLNITNGGQISDLNGNIGNNTGSVGTATVSGTGSRWNHSSNLFIGTGGTGILNVLNGGSISAVGSNIGTNAGSTGTATVDGLGSSWTNSGGFFVGLIGSGTLTIQNSGTVTANSFITVGRNAGSIGNLTIQSGGILHSYDAEMAYAGGQATGLITGTGSQWNVDSNAYLAATSDPTVPAAGTATLTVANGGSLLVGSGTGTLTIANTSTAQGTLNIGGTGGGAAAAAGAVSASTVTFGSGTGTINFNHNTAGYIFAPAITGNGTINALAGDTTLSGDLTGFTGSTNLLGGDLAYTFGTGSTLSTPVSGSGSLTIASGGTTFLTSNSSGFSGTTTVADGSTLSVNGQLGGTLSVSSGGTLKGSGTGGAVTAAAGAILAPGNSIGTLTVSSLSTNSGTIYQAEVAGSGASDLIHATGAATLGGGTVQVIPTGGIYHPSTQYTIITADGGVSGAFDGATSSGTSLFLTPSLSYDANHVYLALARNGTSFASTAGTSNERAVASAIDTMNPSSDTYGLVSGLGNNAAAQAAYNSLSGEAHASNQSSLLQGEHLVSDLVLNRLEAIGNDTDDTQSFQLAYNANDVADVAPNVHRSGVWVQGFGDWSRRKGDSNSASIYDNTSGVLMGVDGDLASLGDRWRGGGAIGYSYTNMKDGARTSNANSTNYHAAVYAGTRPSINHLTLKVGADLTWHDVTSTRNVTVGGITDIDKGDYNAYSAQAFADLSQPFVLSKSSSFAPFGTVAFLHQSTDSFTETGGSSALSVEDGTNDLFSTTFGLRGATHVTFHDPASLNTHSADLSASAGWKHLIGDVTPSSTASFASGSSAFTVDGAPLARDAFSYNANATLPIDNAASLTFSYQGQLASEAQAQSIMGTFKWKF